MIERYHEQEEVSAPEEPKKTADTSFENRLRPKTLEDFIGQPQLKENLSILLEAAKKRAEPIDHLLFHGNPGLGKTTLAHVIAAEIGARIHTTSGPALEKSGDLAAILSNLQDGDVLFIDEIHRLQKTIEEMLYPAMEDFSLDLVMGQGPTARMLRLDLKRFTLIGATTRLSLIAPPLRDRFGAVFTLPFYSEAELSEIIKRNAMQLECVIDSSAQELIARRARQTPRVANRLLRRVRDYAVVRGDGEITEAMAQAALELLEIDDKGLTALDRHILRTMIEKFNGGPVGLTTLSAATQEELATLEEVHEPFLLQQGLLQRTPRGRIATPLAYAHLGYA